MTLTKYQLYLDLYTAYKCAIKHKANKWYVKEFKKDLAKNLTSLRDELWNHTYKAKPSTCFIIQDPKTREIFAADFRDRVVHHLYYNYTHDLFERTFISDTYSCIKGKGTHFGISRLKTQINKCSENYTKETFALKLDIKGYFVNIVRNKLLDITQNSLRKMRYHVAIKETGKTWDDIRDFDFINYLTREIILLDPVVDCILLGDQNEWIALPKHKSLRYLSKFGCGLPIENLTSQLFSNVYLNVLDQFIKRELKCKYYGHYVDDFYIVSNNKQELLNLIPSIRKFLFDNLGLELNNGKIKITNVMYGVEFLGAFIKPHRTYVASHTLHKIQKQLNSLATNPHKFETINSLLGVLSHYDCFKLRKRIVESNEEILKVGHPNKTYTKIIKL